MSKRAAQELKDLFFNSSATIRTNYPIINLNEPEINNRADFPSNSTRTTKYTVVTFLPRMLWEQFRKLTSVYFLIVLILSFFPSISPFSPWSTFLGFAFIIVVSALREAYEDFLRFKADLKENNTKFQTVQAKTGHNDQTKSKNIEVGSLVHLTANQQVPADLVVLTTSSEDGLCYVETAQLDGETNLKLRKAPEFTKRFNKNQLAELTGRIECEPPNPQIYTFRGQMRIGDMTEPIPLQAENLLQKGVHVRNTEWLIGICVYAGGETKLALNQKPPPSKMSTLDKKMNTYVFGILIFQFAICIALGVGAGFFNANFAVKSPYLAMNQISDLGSPAVGMQMFFSYFILLSYLIPISLVVSLEIVKVIQAKFMEWDNNMTVGKKHMVAKTSNLNDELGLVEYVFSDKTGTLTENKMIFAKCSIRGYCIDDKFGGKIAQELDSKYKDNIRIFLYCLALCNSALVEHKHSGNRDLSYKASSPDEKALVKAAANNGFRLIKKPPNSAYLSVQGQEESWEILDTLEFTSERRRMSVVTRSPNKRIIVWSKGSDAVMWDRASTNSFGDNLNELEVQEKIKNDIHQFSKEGLRTLVIGYKEVSEEEFEEFHNNYQRALASINDREEEVEKVCDVFERGFNVIGCTAIEDKLQEHVPETINYLLNMGIKVWMITGDKQETAIDIGYSSQLLEKNCRLLIVNSQSSAECGKILNEFSQELEAGSEQSVSMVINGTTLAFALEDHKIEFTKLTSKCHSVICSRVTPLQKALAVKLVQDSLGVVGLSIGDGANDVSMIQEARVGVGVFGKEGTQAARSADFALRRFKHLQRLLAIHGRYSLLRSAGVIHYSLYKNAAIFMVFFWWSFFCGFSATSLYDDWIMALFNTVIAALPPIIYGVFEKDISEKLINTHPRAYSRTQSKRVFTPITLITWLTFAMYHSLVFFFGTWLVTEHDILSSSGQIGGMSVLGNVTLTLGVLVIFLKLAIETCYWTIITHLGYWLSLALYFAILILQNYAPYYFPSQAGVIEHIAIMPTFWLWLPLAIAICLLPDIVMQHIRREYFIEEWQVIQEDYKKRKAEGTESEIISETPFEIKETNFEERVSYSSDKDTLSTPLLQNANN
eukprot:TRINITY_DN2281_c2_g1_i1.p1 TRINITY_DN2281_c2_g1~~TRINITY_DN2281_c2_g1_i1.p1  ORF type:complete len:1111 (-),score=448.96 TRINITY_DN2281_c2_g1_i1:197-3529(-)